MNRFFAILITVFAISGQAFAGGKIRVINQAGLPIAGANVLIGSAAGQPFEGNTVTTDVNGEFAVPEAWAAALPVTIESGDYVRATFLAMEPVAQTVQVHRADSRTKIEINGQATSFPDLKRDGKVDFGIVYPALTRRQLIQFDVSSVVSSEVDVIRVVDRDVKVPSNLTLPNQSESYILPINLNKPNYRMFVSQAGQYRMMATHGQFPLRQVVNDLRNGKKIFDVINYFRFIGGGQRDIAADRSVPNQDIPVNQIPFTNNVSITGPQIPTGLVMLSFSLVDQAGLFFPADIKRIMTGETMQLGIPDGSTQNYVVSLLLREDIAGSFDLVDPIKPEPANLLDFQAGLFMAAPKDALKTTFQYLFGGFANQGKGEPSGGASSSGLSIALTESSEATPQFLDMIPQPELVEKTLKFTAPRQLDGVEAVATYVILSEIERAPEGEYRAERRFRVWELFQPGWTKEITLPDVATNLDPAKNYRWEVLFLARRSGKNGSDGYFLDTVTHVTRASFDF